MFSCAERLPAVDCVDDDDDGDAYDSDDYSWSRRTLELAQHRPPDLSIRLSVKPLPCYLDFCWLIEAEPNRDEICYCGEDSERYSAFLEMVDDDDSELDLRPRVPANLLAALDVAEHA